MKTALYRHFDEDGVLLYVGISANPWRRQDRHTDTSEWIEKSQKFELSWFEDRLSALKAEAMAIRPEHGCCGDLQPVFAVGMYDVSADQSDRDVDGGAYALCHGALSHTQFTNGKIASGGADLPAPAHHSRSLGCRGDFYGGRAPLCGVLQSVVKPKLICQRSACPRGLSEAPKISTRRLPHETGQYTSQENKHGRNERAA